MIGIINYGAGNLRSISQAINFLGYEVKIISFPEQAEGVEKLIIPGVGSFGAAMSAIREKNLENFIYTWLVNKKPLLGICLGLQLLCEGSEESPGESGFGFFPGRCRKLRAGKIPHIGWNKIKIIQRDPIFEGFSGDEYFYFVHSFYREEADRFTLALTEYGQVFSSVLKKDSIYACQFHPEKSGETGLRFLRNWVERC
ncbi:MAG: imidazole glycerol phosphate synthase subunit HisH [Candidatus Saccharicenans sp.]